MIDDINKADLRFKNNTFILFGLLKMLMLQVLIKLIVQKVFFQFHFYQIISTMETNELKPLQQMIRQLGEQNNIPDNLLKLCQNNLNKIYKKINELHKAKDTTAVLAELKTWYQSQKHKIVQLKDYSSGESDEFLIDIMINIAKGVWVAFSKMPRYHQMICLWFNLHSNKTILEVKTGQGKTIIVAMTALYFALRNKKVDVFTSSSNLAMTETNHDSSVRKLFNIFDISLADVCRDRLSLRHRPYTCQVIYGTSFEFQADYLTKVFTGNNLFFQDRNFDENHVAILDEVDALLIDRMRDSTRLSSQKPLFECIKTILILIHEVKKQLVAVKMKFAQIKQVKILGRVLSDYKKMQFFSISNTEQIDEQAFIKHQKQQIQEIVYGTITSQFKHLFPNYLMDGKDSYINTMLPLWINSIYQIQNYEEDVDFRVCKETNQIIPIDISTGTYQKNTKWMNGVHQFLEIKYQIDPSVDSIVTNYESNFIFFHRYKYYLYGLTGTIAESIGKQTNKDSIFQSFLKYTYSVNIYKIPTAKKRLLYVQYPRFFGNKDQWMQGLYKDSMLYANDRMVLLIFQTIKQAKQYIINFPKKSEYPIVELHDHDLYFQSLKKQRLDVKRRIIVSTNLGGRGTDIQINNKDILNNGGLFVMMTYFATNWRIEEQAFGRAARNGQPGSGAFYINLDSQSLCGINLWKQKNICNGFFQKIVDMRTVQQKERFQQAKIAIQNQKIKKTVLDDFFNHYLKNQQKRIEQLEKEVNRKDRIISICKEQLIELYNKQMQCQLAEEQWGIYLKKKFIDTNPGKQKKIRICFDDFKRQYTNNRSHNDVNPGYFAKYGSKMFNIDRQKSQKLFDLALQRNQNNWVSKYYKLYFKLYKNSDCQLNKSIVQQITADIKNICQIIITEFSLNLALKTAIKSNQKNTKQYQLQLFYVDIISYLKTISQSLIKYVISEKQRIKISCRMEQKDDINVMLSLKGLRHTIVGFQMNKIIQKQKQNFLVSVISGIWSLAQGIVTAAFRELVNVAAKTAKYFEGWVSKNTIEQLFQKVKKLDSQAQQHFKQFYKRAPAVLAVAYGLLCYMNPAVGLALQALGQLVIWAYIPPQISNEAVSLSQAQKVSKNQTKLVQIIGIGQLNQDANKKINQFRQKLKNKQIQRTSFYNKLYQQLKGLDVRKDKQLLEKMQRIAFSKDQTSDIKQQKKNQTNQILNKYKIIEQVNDTINSANKKKRQLSENILLNYQALKNRKQLKKNVIKNKQELIRLSEESTKITYHNISFQKVHDKNLSSIIKPSEFHLIQENKMNEKLLKKIDLDQKEMIALEKQNEKILNIFDKQSRHQKLLTTSPSQIKDSKAKKCVQKFQEKYIDQLGNKLMQKSKRQAQKLNSEFSDQLKSNTIETLNKTAELKKKSQINPVNMPSKINQFNYFEDVVRQKCLYEKINYIKVETQESLYYQLQNKKYEFVMVFKKVIIYRYNKNKIVLKIYEKASQNHNFFINNVKKRIPIVKIVNAKQVGNCGRDIISDLNKFIYADDIKQQSETLSDIEVQKQFLKALVIKGTKIMIEEDKEYTKIREERKLLSSQSKQFLPHFMMPFELGINSLQFKQFGNKLNDKICQYIFFSNKQLEMNRQLVESARSEMMLTEVEAIKTRYPQFKMLVEVENKKPKRV